MLTSSCSLLFSSDPFWFLHWSLSSDHEPEGLFCDGYLCSIRFPAVSWCSERSLFWGHPLPCNTSHVIVPPFSLLSLTGAIFTAQPQHTCGLSNPLSHEPLKASLRGIQLLRTAVSHRIVDCQNPGSVLKAISQRNKILTIYIKRIVFSFIPSLYWTSVAVLLHFSEMFP